MRLSRILLILVILLGGFWLVTSYLEPLHSMGRNRLFPTGSTAPLELTEAHAAPKYDAEEENNIGIYKRVLPSVVNITSTALVFDFFYGTVPQQGQGSGFILDKAGHILTNFHVVAGANRGVEVQLSDKRKFAARVIGTDRTHDLAL
ncbi:MAG: trypsin-like peptidase domain-containing protein, partial [Rhizomicrobium sp.]